MIVLAWILVLNLLSSLDAYFTLMFLERGVEEANPAMAWVLETWGESAFLAVKGGLVLGGSLILGAQGRETILSVTVGIYMIVLIIHTFA